jgi:type II secretory pathway pseudopilin PulG
MGSPGRSRTRRISLKACDGFSLPELLVAMTLFIVVVAAAGSVLAPAQRSANDDIENSTSQAEAQAQLDRMVRDLRQGTKIITANDNQMTVLVNDGSQVSYKCDTADTKWTSYNACYRLTAANEAATLSAPGAGNVVVSRVLNGTTADPTDPVFTYTLPTVDETAETDDEASDSGNTPDALSPAYVAVSLKLPAKGEKTTGGRTRTIAFNSGFALRNIRYAVTNGVG